MRVLFIGVNKERRGGRTRSERCDGSMKHDGGMVCGKRVGIRGGRKEFLGRREV